MDTSLTYRSTRSPQTLLSFPQPLQHSSHHLLGVVRYASLLDISLQEPTLLPFTSPYIWLFGSSHSSWSLSMERRCAQGNTRNTCYYY